MKKLQGGRPNKFKPEYIEQAPQSRRNIHRIL
jgi:hypothetical protein